MRYNINMKTVVITILLGVLSGFYILRPEATPVPVNNPVGIPEVKELEKAPEISVIITPDKFIQGEPVLVEVSGMDSTSSPQAIKSITLEGKPLKVFINKSKTSALIGIDLRKTPGKYPLVVTLSDGGVIKKDLVVGERAIVKEEFHIPEKLGGDTKESEENLISTLVQEGAIINAIPTGPEKLWDGAFRFPVESITITDTYGYSRATGGSSISHKGTDFRAAVGTSVYAMNSGRVAYTDYLRNYGHTIVVDHGLGVQTIYMHLSEVLVKNGDAVTKWQLIAKSGDTGYTFGAHLHLSVKIDHISIDPMKFMEILGK